MESKILSLASISRKESDSSEDSDITTIVRAQRNPTDNDYGLGEDLLDLNTTNPSLLFAFLEKNPDVLFVWIQTVDYLNSVRVKMFPIDEFINIIVNAERISCPNILIGRQQSDILINGRCDSGHFRLICDLSTLTRNVGLPNNLSPSASVQTFWLQDKPSVINLLKKCPRGNLLKQSREAESIGLTLLVGFEIEIYFLKPIKDSNNNTLDYEAPQGAHCWTGLTQDDLTHLPLVEEIVKNLALANIKLQNFHAEAGPGQWEFVLPPSKPLAAVDMFNQARSIIMNTAYKYGLKATMHPRPINDKAGTACHCHISINETSLQYESSWLAGILEHLPSILAFSLPAMVSYDRVKGSIWSGGEWVTWGYQNKQAPIRKVSHGHLEMKTLDGMANAYLATAALIAAGLDGVRGEKQLIHKDCPFDAAKIDDRTRRKFGIVTRFPKTQDQALTLLQQNAFFVKEFGEDLIKDYVETRQLESRVLMEMGPRKARNFLIARY